MKSRIYLDHAATTPVDPRVFRAMRPYLGEKFGNPGSLHSFGQEAMAAVDEARETIARALGRDERTGFREIIFTGSATEANNLVLRGAIARLVNMRHSELARNLSANVGTEILRFAQDDKNKPRIIISSVEHESVLETAKGLEQNGVEVIYLPVDGSGRVKLAALREALSPETVLVSVMYVNNETGAIQPIKEIAKILREFGELSSRPSSRDPAFWIPGQARNDRLGWNNTRPLFHTDAAQALGHLDCKPDNLGVDLMTISAHKINGPKGIGALFLRDATALHPILTGGGQEFGFRSATENVAGIVGFGEAVRLLGGEKERARTEAHILGIKELFLKELKRIAPKIKINGSKNGSTSSPQDVSPHIANIWLPGKPADLMLIALDRLGVAISSGSACRSRSLQPSYVLEAMGLPEQRAKESLRISLGKTNTPAEVRRAIQAFKKVLSSKH